MISPSPAIAVRGKLGLGYVITLALDALDTLTLDINPYKNTLWAHNVFYSQNKNPSNIESCTEYSYRAK